MITDPRRAERFIRRRWGRLLREAFYVDAPNLNGWKRYWFAVVTFDEEHFQTIPVLAQSILTTPTGSLQNTTSGIDASWNNLSNFIECVGGGASGGAGVVVHATGGGGGQYAKIVNFTVASPGVTTFQWKIGALAAAVSSTTSSAGTGGDPSWFNSAADPGAGADNTKCGAKGGGAGNAGAGSRAGGTGGTGGWGTTLTTGGPGGALTGASGTASSGGGGAAGPNGAGNNGVDSSSTSAIATDGGSGDAGVGGAAGANASGTNAQTGGAGGTATEFDGTHGCGGGGGGARGTNASRTSVGGDGGLYGGGGGGGTDSTAGSQAQTSGNGVQGIIVLTWTPAGGAAGDIPFFGFPAYIIAGMT